MREGNGFAYEEALEGLISMPGEGPSAAGGNDGEAHASLTLDARGRITGWDRRAEALLGDGLEGTLLEAHLDLPPSEEDPLERAREAGHARFTARCPGDAPVEGTVARLDAGTPAYTVTLQPARSPAIAELLQATPHPLLVVDASDEIVALNTPARELFDASEETLLGEDLRTLLPGLDLDAGSVLEHLDGDDPTVRFPDLEAHSQETTTPVDVEIGGWRTPGDRLAVVSLRDRTHEQVLEEELRSALSLHKTTLQASGEGILVVDAQRRRITSYNDRFLELFDIPEEVAQTRDPDQLIDHVLDDLADPDAFLERVEDMYGDMEREFIDLIRFEDGRVIERTSRPRRVDGEIVGRVSSFRDVTEHRGAEGELRRTLSLQEAILDATADGILVVNQEGRVVAHNDRFRQLWDVPEEIAEEGDDEALLAHVADQLEDPDAFLEKVEFLYDHPEAESFDVLRFEDGRQFERYSRPVRIDDEIQGRVWSFRDVTKYKRTHQRLRRSEAQFRSFFENMPIGLYRTTPDGRILLVNPRLVEMVGYESAEEITTRNLEDDEALFEPDYSREEFRRTLEQEGEIRGLEARWTLRDGSTVYVRESARAVRDEDGEIAYYEGTVEDITERKLAEQRLRESRQRLETLVENAPLILATLDPDGTITFASGSALERLGLDAEGLEGENAIELWSDHPGLTESLEAALAGERRRDTVQIGDVWLHIETLPLFGDEGELEGVIRVAMDITERKQAEIQLRESQQRLQTLVENAPIILCSLTPQGEIEFVAGRALEAIGVTPEDFTGRSALDIYDPDETAYQTILEALAGEPQSTTARIEGEWFQVETVPIHDEAGNLDRIITVAIDITERVEAEEQVRRLNEELEQRVRERTAQLEAANEELEAFSYSVSHDLRGPLQTIDGFSQILMEDHAEELDESGQALLDRLRGASQTMARLIDSILSLSRLTRREMQPTEVDLSEMARTILEDLQRRNPDREVQIEVEDGLVDRGDPALLESMLENLLRNAWKFTEGTEDAHIRFGAREEDGQRVYHLEDNGAGFDPRYKDKLFQPFQRLHDEEEFEGTGVGLASVERILRRHGGEVWADGEPGEGATFRFTLGSETG